MNNILLFVPVGTFLYNLRPKSSTFYFPFLVSLGVEVLQFMTGRGLFEIDRSDQQCPLGGLIGWSCECPMYGSLPGKKDPRHEET